MLTSNRSVMPSELTGRATPSLRSGTSRARCSVVGDVERPQCSDALGDLAATPLARSPMPTVAALSTGAINRASEAVTVDAYGIARAIVAGNANGHRTRYYPHVTAPAKQVRAVPLTPAGTAAAEQPRSSPQPRRRPRRPRHRPRQRSCHVLCSIPGALAPSMRHTHRVNA